MLFSLFLPSRPSWCSASPVCVCMCVCMRGPACLNNLGLGCSITHKFVLSLFWCYVSFKCVFEGANKAGYSNLLNRTGLATPTLPEVRDQRLNSHSRLHLPGWNSPRVSGELLVHYLLSKVFSVNDLLTSSSSDLLCRVCSTSQLPKTPALFVEDLRIRIWRGCGDPPHKKYSISHNLDNKYICLQNVWKARACHQQHTQSLMIKTCLVFVLMLSTLMWHLFGLRGAHNGFACCARAL